MVETSSAPTRSHRWTVFALVTTLAVGSVSAIAVMSSSHHGGRPAVRQTRALVSAPVVHADSIKSAGTTAPTPPTVPTAAVTPASVATTPVAALPTPPVAAVPTAPVAVTTPSIATLVAAVEASGVDPGSNWTWSVGDPSTHCGPISGTGTGCTYGEAGREYTIFAGTPTLTLVAHELGNAETQNDAVPSLLSEVATAAAGTSWSPTDAVASCLVAHFMGFQDGAAGSWQCPASLAQVVAEHIHDTY
jgi:hypothetical protein